MKRTLPFLAVLVAGACIPATKSVGEATETEGSTGSTGSTGDSSTDSVPGSTGVTATGSLPPGDGSTTTGDASDVTTGEPPFECVPSPGELQCDVLAQDCPAGSHCVPGDVGSNFSEGSLCVPLSDAPAERYDACTPDLATCTDDCAEGTFCREGTSVPGMCLGMCDISGDPGSCLPDEMCLYCASCNFGLCVATCDPFEPQCPLGAPCSAALPDGFICRHWQGQTVGVGETCVASQECDPGLVCWDAVAHGGACEGESCCTELCDLVDGDPACSDPEHVCLSVYLPGLEHEGLEHVGFCGVPEADLCLVPGNCPPPGIDATYPWCPDTYSEYCPEGGLAGYSDGSACESGCLCRASCDDTLACPVPPTGTAVPECVEDPFGPGTEASCLLPCSAGETCPDGMTCSDIPTTASGEPVCIWVSPMPPDRC
jgi:hypothetical protein